ncbi:hypothetical protein [Sphingobacterium sp.]|uniref:hypothetical protein n=1 Tax=Sphingobacterium sp. TaxID=341027 RepID=UPI0028B12C2D|nr:hypothetical protein [Sphingobacterium sp.]
MEKVPLIKTKTNPSLSKIMDSMAVNDAFKVEAKPSYARQLQYHFKSHTKKRFRVWTKREDSRTDTFIGRIA